MRRAAQITLIVIMITNLAFAALDIQPVDAEQSQHWLCYTVPLPKQIKIESKIQLPAGTIAVTSSSDSDQLVGQAITELRDVLGGGATDTNTARFVITLQLGGPEAEPLKELKNNDQAGRIFVEPDNKGLRIVGLHPRGLYYAAKTLKQLLAAKTKDGNVEIPLLTMTDWPDMEDRGLWGADSYNHVPWMSDRKLNIIEQISDIGVKNDKTTWARPKTPQKPYVELGPRYGIKPVPVVLHLEQISGKGLFANYPELKPKGENVHEGAICYAQPIFVDILADWIVELASQPGVEEVDVWMAENLQGLKGCQCDFCKKHDRFELEAKVIVDAWKKAKERVPGVGLRILTSEATEDSNEKIFASLPKDVKVWYYHSLLTYTCGESPMLRPYIEKFARQGRWIGVCPNIAMVHFAQPFTTAHFVRYRVSEFINKGLSGMIGYATPRVHCAFFNVEAMAEWSWNLEGRSEREFAYSWAVRRGLPNPDMFAEWSELIGPVAWDVAGSDWPFGEQRNVPGKVAARLKKNDLPELGFVLWDAYRSPWGDIKTVEQLDRDVAAAQRAFDIAQEMAIKEFYAESLIVQGYIESLKALWELKHLVTPDGIADENFPKAYRHFRMYVNGLHKVVISLPEWDKQVRKKGDPDTFTEKPITVINQMIAEMTELAASVGLKLD